jgi:hypothetical protein
LATAPKKSVPAQKFLALFQQLPPYLTERLDLEELGDGRPIDEQIHEADTRRIAEQEAIATLNLKIAEARQQAIRYVVLLRVV